MVRKITNFDERIENKLRDVVRYLYLMLIFVNICPPSSVMFRGKKNSPPPKEIFSMEEVKK